MRFRSLAIVLTGLGLLALAYCLGRTQGASATNEKPAAHQAAARDARADASARGPMVARTASAAVSLPGRDIPLRRALPGLQARADAGDVAAASRVYRDLRFCASLDGMEWFFTRMADELLDEKVNGSDAQQLENYRVQLDAIESRKQAMQNFHAFCEGIDRTVLDRQLPSLQKAAQLGDEQARSCYLARGPSYDPAGLLRHPEWLQGYRANAKSLVDAGIAAGDWKVVDILRNAYQPGADGVLAGALGADPALYYRYLKLYGLGAAPDRAREIQQQLAAAAARISPVQRADADLWAQTNFQQKFTTTNPTDAAPQGWDPCAFSTVPYDDQ